MKASRYLVIAAVILGVVGLQLTFAAITKRPPVTIVKAGINKNLVIAAGTGLNGVIKINGTLPTQLKAMSCADLKVFIGTYKTPPAGGGMIAVPTFEEVVSNAATGNIASGSCAYAVRGVPAGQEFDVLLNANPDKFACDRVTLMAQPSTTKVTFQAGKTETRDFQISPTCEIVK
jgi:hypothetical protein